MKGCSICAKGLQNIKILTEVRLNLHSLYPRPDGELEEMNGLWRETSEIFCEECFKKYAETLTEFYKTHKKMPVKA